MPRLMPSLMVGLLTQQLLPGTQIDRVPDKRKRTPGLAAMLWPKSKEHHTPFTHRHFGQGNLVFDFVFAPQPAGPEHIVFSITSDDMDFVVRCFQCGTVDEVSISVFRHCARDWICRVDV